MRQVQRDPAHRRRVSETLKGQTYVCSLCGKEGHNRRTCPENAVGSAPDFFNSSLGFGGFVP